MLEYILLILCCNVSAFLVCGKTVQILGPIVVRLLLPKVSVYAPSLKHQVLLWHSFYFKIYLSLSLELNYVRF